VANQKHIELLRRGVAVWNKWRETEPLVRPDLAGASFAKADLMGAFLNGASLDGAGFREANLYGAHLIGASCRAINFKGAILHGAKCQNADLTGATINKANLNRADLEGAFLCGANLAKASFIGTKLCSANLTEADLSNSVWDKTDLSGAILTGCRVYGVSAWNVKIGEGTQQQNLVITDRGEPEVTVDNIEVAQFVYLLLHNEKIRHVIDTVGKKGVLLLGRFTEGRIAVLERLREELRKRGYLPIVFNFDKPETKTFLETVRVLAGLSRFVIADVTDPQSVPAELQAAVPAAMVPFVPIVRQKQKKPYALLESLRIEHTDRVLRAFHYSSLDALVVALDEKIIKPAEARFAKLQAKKARG
jgi:Pentapeptide repeats (8 copies)